MFLLKSISSPVEDDLVGFQKLSETVAWVFPLLGAESTDARLLLSLDSKSDEANDAVVVTPTAPSWCGGGNFSLLLVPFTFASIFRRWKIEIRDIRQNVETWIYKDNIREQIT